MSKKEKPKKKNPKKVVEMLFSPSGDRSGYLDSIAKELGDSKKRGQ